MLEIPDTITNQAKGFTYRYRLDGTDIYITGGGPSPYSPFQEIFIELMGSEYISLGIWKISLEPISVKDGSWDIWLPSGALRNAQTSFIHASPDITLTSPQPLKMSYLSEHMTAEQTAQPPFPAEAIPGPLTA